MGFTLDLSAEFVIKSVFTALTGLYAVIAYSNTQDRSPSDPSFTEWDVCWPVATWYISWHAAICLSVVSLPPRLFTLDVHDLEYSNHRTPTRNPYWTRFVALLSWYLMGIPIAYMMQDSCSVGAPGIWAHSIRAFVEGIVVFALGAFIYVLDRYLLPLLHSYQVLSPSTAEAVPSARAGELA